MDSSTGYLCKEKNIISYVLNIWLFASEFYVYLILTVLEDATEAIQAVAEVAPSRVLQLYVQHLCQPNIK